MNKSKIDWCDMTWNVVTGCLHGCEYCYAEAMVRRFGNPEYATGEIHVNENSASEGLYPYGFDPTLHRYKLDLPKNTKIPQRVFVTSMGDLFGEWVPDKWIGYVFDSCADARDHTYMFLTKNPARYHALKKAGLLPHGENCWFGFTATNQEDFEKAWRASAWMDYYSFVSIEPLRGEIDITIEKRIQWVIVGAQTGSRAKENVPERAWIEKIVSDCRDMQIPIFMKNNLRSAWGAPLIQQFPSCMKQV